MVARARCLEIMDKHLAHREVYITSWFDFDYAREYSLVPEGASQGQLLRAVAYGVKEGWLDAYWVGVGMTPFAGSAKRQRMYDITPSGKKAVEDSRSKEIS